MLIGVSVVRDEMPLLPLVCAHLLRQGLDLLIIADHRSEDGTREWLEAAARRDSRIVAVRTGVEQFQQAATVTALARTACSLGATWVLPFDADEFWVSTRPGCTLADAIRAHEREGAAALKCRVRNFVADRGTSRFEADSLESVRFAAPRAEFPVGQDEMAQVGAFQRPFVLLPFEGKVLFKARPDVWVRAGAHSAGTVDAHFPPTSSDAVVCAHLPLRSRATLAGKARHGDTLRLSGFGPAHGWQEQVIAAACAAGRLDDFWNANSMALDRIECADGSFFAEPDDTLRELYREIRGEALATHAAAFERPSAVGSKSRPPSLEDALLETARSLAAELEKTSVSSAAVREELRTALVALDAARDEILLVRTGAEQVRRELAATVDTRTWRWTRWSRRVFELLRRPPAPGQPRRAQDESPSWRKFPGG
jgi:hypothetical protein